MTGTNHGPNRRAVNRNGAGMPFQPNVYGNTYHKANEARGSTYVKGQRTATGNFSTAGTIEVAPWALDALNKTGRPPNTKNTHCGRGHEYVEGSFDVRKDMAGYEHRRCKICKAEIASKTRASRTSDTRARLRESNARTARERRAAKKLGVTVEEYRATLEQVVIVKKNPLDYLKTTAEQAAASDAVNFAVDDRGRPRCETDPDAFTDVDNITSKQARILCGKGTRNECPLMEECLRVGLVEGVGDTKPEGLWIYGGHVLQNGKIVEV